MTDENARIRRILGRVCLRYASQKLLNKPTSLVNITHGKYGKPEIDNLSISVSHTACLDQTQLCVCSAALGGISEFGIDIAMRNKPLDPKFTASQLIHRLKVTYFWGVGIIFNMKFLNTFFLHF